MVTEQLIPELDHQGLRRFGLATGAIVVVLFGLFFPWLLDRAWPLWPWIILAVLGGLAVVAPLALEPVYRGWMRFGLLASRITTPLILGIIFFLLISPIALFRRALGFNDMRRPFDEGVASYRIQSRSEPGSLERPF